MQSPPDWSLPQFDKARAALARLAEEIAPLNKAPPSRRVEAWFLGTKGENADVLEALILDALRDHVFWRRNYFPADPTHVSEAMRRDPDYLAALGTLREGFREVLGLLKKSVPFFSMRYQGHMNWDLTIPSMAGYFAAMLYNPNNVATEASTATTLLEMLVGDDLCRMLGYQIPEGDTSTGVRPWGHITCDGTVANIEALWAARNLKFYPLSLREALRSDPSLADARSMEVVLPTGDSAPLVGLERWQLLNLGSDAVLALPERMRVEFGIERQVVTEAVAVHSLQALGWMEFARRFLGAADASPALCAPVFVVPGTRHYSFPKAAAVLGLGASNMLEIPVDADGRVSLQHLEGQLERCLASQCPVIAVVAVMGTTEEGAVDPMADIVQLRDEFAQRGLAFHLHADAAWGGYHRSINNNEFAIGDPGWKLLTVPEAPLSAQVSRSLGALGQADSITVDPHKSGYIPYPAGALCYRNAAMRDLVSFSAPVIYRGEAAPTVGIYGIEGSKPGAAPAAVYLSHRVIRPTRSGYGKILGQALFTCRQLYARLLAMDESDFMVVPLPRLPAERNGGDAVAERARVVERIARRSGDDIRRDRAAMRLLREIGPDLNILAYAFNFYTRDGKLNTDLAAANSLNKAVYDRLSIDPGTDIYGYPLILSSTDLDPAAYGPPLIEDYRRRLGVTGPANMPITVLRSVVMDPWVTETAQGSFLDVIERELRNAVSAEVRKIKGG